ncbi:MAG TPA: heme ABC exporter ATP-binding protein CcmA [Sphingorhabdus sp.]|jgi:heme exporter protein A|uniref:heme ABC exporter ATP-binding protein CcmA n=1 Tax=Sphingorhabdus sp. TaxID=1902408 RepID=UPI002BCF59AB|nr:heme ABC exporter ATP-binding protein CcmA [Sphingorhabdus sp.]HMT42298.1 heme ABC exporter ATP-binding protein CcmA [Sphingorhabdus sp.]HMU21105.1 heme ABC exporter ATP-binding protein CcmA [Sphingorhabdus sp.]
MPHSQAASPSIKLNRVAIIRGTRVILRDFDLEVERGELVWVRGANGSGKSTLFRALSGLLPVASGEVSISGAIALCDDNLALDLDQRLGKAIRFWTDLDAIKPAKLEAALETLDLIGLADLPVRLLSAGQKRRGALARLLASDVPIWLLDEPYNGLDQANVARLDAALSRHTEQGGIALVASHIAPTVIVTRSLVIDRPKAELAA